MKKYLIGILLLLILTSCTEQPKCGSDEALQLAKDLIKQELKSDENILYSLSFKEGDEKLIDQFVDENIELTSIRTIEKNEELRTCNCASLITFKYSEDFQNKMKDDYRDNNKYFRSEFVLDESEISATVNKIINEQFEYYYNLQILEKEKNLYLEGIVPKNELKNSVLSFLQIADKYGTKKEKEEETESQENKPESNNTENSNKEYYYAIVKNAISPIYEEPKLYTKTEYSYDKGDTIHFRELKNGWILFDYSDDNDKIISGYCKEADLIIKKK